MRIFIFSFILVFFLGSCNKPCKGVICAEYKVYSFKCKIQDFLTFENIFYSDNFPYLKENFKVFSVENGDTNYHFIEHFEADSSFKVTFSHEIKTFYAKLDDSDIDTVTLNIHYVVPSYIPNYTICCPKNKTITGIYYNGTAFNPTSNGTILYKK